MKHVIRSVKYLIAFIVLYLGVVWISLMTSKGIDVSVWDYVATTLASQRGKLLIGAVVLLSAFYPRFGFMSRHIKLNIDTDRDHIIERMAAAGFSPIEQSEDRLVLRANSILDRLMMLFEDEIEVKRDGEGVMISGNRRGLAKIVYRLS